MSTVRPSCGEVAQEAAQPADALGVEAVGRLVEDEDARVAEQRGGQAEPLAHAHASSRRPAGVPRRDADELEHLVDARVRHARGGGQDAQVVAAGAARVEVRRLEGGPDDA